MNAISTTTTATVTATNTLSSHDIIVTACLVIDEAIRTHGYVEAAKRCETELLTTLNGEAQFVRAYLVSSKFPLNTADRVAEMFATGVSKGTAKDGAPVENVVKFYTANNVRRALVKDVRLSQGDRAARMQQVNKLSPMVDEEVVRCILQVQAAVSREQLTYWATKLLTSIKYDRRIEYVRKGQIITFFEGQYIQHLTGTFACEQTEAENETDALVSRIFNRVVRTPGKQSTDVQQLKAFVAECYTTTSLDDRKRQHNNRPSKEIEVSLHDDSNCACEKPALRFVLRSKPADQRTNGQTGNGFHRAPKSGSATYGAPRPRGNDRSSSGGSMVLVPSNRDAKLKTASPKPLKVERPSQEAINERALRIAPYADFQAPSGVELLVRAEQELLDEARVQAKHQARVDAEASAKAAKLARTQRAQRSAENSRRVDPSIYQGRANKSAKQTAPTENDGQNGKRGNSKPQGKKGQNAHA